MLGALGVIVLYALGEFMLVRWTLSAVERKPVRTALNAGVVRAIAAVGVFAVVDHRGLIFAAIVGDMIGSYIGTSVGDYEEEDDDGSEADDIEEARSEASRAARQRPRDGETWDYYSAAGSRD
jgi:predicted acylesterase/phospholipase RssA